VAVQSLYRRYRPRRFSELRGQEHIVRALRNSVINEREGQAYLFSGPRGTGKTSTARILAKVLNCESPVEGEPCCECASCVAVEAGTSYDVIELDAASNNGVEAARELIDRAGLGSPGRHRVFILDEVHMLSKPAEAALLKTLEEPPSHVVFVLATTDPQKVSETIRSRTQHLQFHLLAMHDLAEHVRFIVADAGLEVTDAAIEQVLVQGGGSARDTLSALELVVAAGGVAPEAVDLDDFIEAIIDGEPARALAAVAFAVQQGHDPRTLGDQLVRHLREAFLTQVAPELVQLPVERAEHVAAWAQRMGNGSIVRSMEAIGDTLIEMRHAPDARLLLEVSLMKLCSPGDSGDVSGLIARIEQLERAVARAASAAPATPPPPRDPATGRAKLGGAARPASDTPRAAPEPKVVKPPAPQAHEKLADEVAPPPVPVAERVPVPATAAAGTTHSAAELWPQVLTSLKPLVRALYSACSVSSPGPDTVVLSAPNAVHQAKCNEHVAIVAAAFEKVTGRKIGLNVDVGDTAKDRSAGVPRASHPKAASNETPHDDHETPGSSDAQVVPAESALDRISRSFPGSKVINEDHGK